MQFFIHFVSSVTAAEEPHVVKLPVVFDLGHAARDDIDVELNGQCDKPVPDFIRILRQPANGLRFADIVEPRHKRSVEIFGKKNEIALIATHGIDEKLHLFEQVVKGLVAAHLPLYDAYAHRGFGQDVLLGRSLIIDVVPLKQAGVVARLLVVGQIVAHYFTDMEIVRELEQQHRIDNFTLAHFVYIFLGAHLFRILMVVGQTAPEHDGFQVEFFAQFLAVFVHAPRQTQSPVVGMDEDLDAVEDVTLAGVGVECFIPRNLGVGVVVLHVIVIHNDRKRAAYDLAVHDYDDLPLREDANQFVDLLRRPKNVASIGIDAGKGTGQLVVILFLKIANFYFIDF